MRIIIDTNLLISALIKPSSVPGKALDIALRASRLCFSQETQAEVTETLVRDKFDQYDPDKDRFTRLEKLFKDADIISTKAYNISGCRDPKDDKFLALAVAANASYIVTGDKDLLVLHPFRGIPILSPADFISLF